MFTDSNYYPVATKRRWVPEWLFHLLKPVATLQPFRAVLTESCQSLVERNVGWYDSPEQSSKEPTYDPPHDAPCPICEKPLTPFDIRTISVMAMGKRRRSYFYRAHRTCHSRLNSEEEAKLDERMVPEVAGCFSIEGK